MDRRHFILGFLQATFAYAILPTKMPLFLSKHRIHAVVRINGDEVSQRDVDRVWEAAYAIVGFMLSRNTSYFAESHYYRVRHSRYFSNMRMLELHVSFVEVRSM